MIMREASPQVKLFAERVDAATVMLRNLPTCAVNISNEMTVAVD